MHLDHDKKEEFLTLNNQEITEMCKEIEDQWEYHLMTRAIFNSKFPHFTKYQAYGFYKSIGNIQVALPLPEERTEVFNRAAKGIGYWHNQNYAIRLCGIVNKHGVLAEGKSNGVKVIVLLDRLRNNVGAHSSGRRISDKKAFRDAIELINELFDRSFDPDKEGSYPLAIDAVLKPLKIQVVEFVKSLHKK